MDFVQIAFLLVVAALGGILAKLVKQPLIIGYVFAGLALSLFGIIGSPEEISALGSNCRACDHCLNYKWSSGKGLI